MIQKHLTTLDKLRILSIKRIATAGRSFHTNQRGAESVEWIAVIAILMILLFVFSRVFEQQSSTMAQEIGSSISCWTLGWNDTNDCGEPSASGTADISSVEVDTNGNADESNNSGGIIDWLSDTASDAWDLLEDISRVDWNGTWDTEGLEGDWGALYGAWALGTRPDDFGVWSTRPDDGKDLVTITSEGYINDLKSKPNYNETIEKFKNEHPSIDELAVGDTVSNPFIFTGQGTTTGDYNALEWFLGSYNTTMTVTGIDRESGTITVETKVINRSHWESGTRVPGSWQEIGIPPYLIPNGFGDITGLGETYWQEFVWEDQIQYPIGSSGHSKNVPLFDLIAWAVNGKHEIRKYFSNDLGEYDEL